MLFPHKELMNHTYLPQNLSLPAVASATNQALSPYLLQQEFNIHNLAKEHSLMSSDFDHQDGCSTLKVSTNTMENSKSTSIEEEELEEAEESYNAEDFTNRSYTYPEYKEYLESSQQNDIQIARCRGQTSFEFSTDSNESLSNQQYVILTVPRILKQFFESQLYGDIILESDYSNYEEKSVNSFCNWKLLSQIQKFTSYVKIHAQDISQSSENFIAAIQICMQHNQKEVFDLAILFTQFSRIYSFIKNGFAKMAEYIEIFSKHDQLLQRHRLFDELSDKYLANVHPQSIYFAVKLGPNFKSQQIETRSICFSNALLKLCCVDVDQFISLSLKGRSPEFFGWQARIMFLRHKLLSYLRQEQFQNGEIIDILTRDGMRVPARSRREKVTFDLDKQLPGLELGQLSEIMVVYHFEIDSTMQSQIEFLRQNHSIDGFENQDQSDFHTYSLETQAFLDLYYSQYKPVSKSMKKKHWPQTITQ